MKISPICVVILVSDVAKTIASSHSISSRAGDAFLQKDLSSLSSSQELLAAPEEWDSEPGHVIKWKAKSDVPWYLQVVLALMWVSMVTAIPFMVPLLDHRPVTRTQIIVCGSTVTVLFGGFFLFTNVILFESIHFEKIRPLTVVECCYFMAQTITTIGYGDIGPAKTRGQLFVGIYVVFSLLVLAMAVEEFTEHLIKVATENLRHYKTAHRGDRERRPSKVTATISPPRPSMKPFCTALAAFAVLDVCWVLFFTLYPGENKTAFQAFYMSLITLGSVGFGFFTPLTEGGMIFGAFMMVIGCTSFALVIGEFTSIIYQMRQYERFNEDDAKIQAVTSLNDITVGSDSVTAMQFVKFWLVHSNKIDNEEFDHILQMFDKMDPKDGVVDRAKIAKLQDIDVESERPDEKPRAG